MKGINLIVVPFHDFKIALTEGFRTRDTHLYQHFMDNDSIANLVIINRPTSLIELFLRRKKLLTSGDVIYNKNGCYVQEIKKNVFIIDILSTDILSVVRLKHAWLPRIYRSSSIVTKIKNALAFLGIHNHAIYMSSPFSVDLALLLGSNVKILDAVDNFVKHKIFAHFKDEIDQLYNTAKLLFDVIFVNSTDTLNYLNTGCSSQLILLENGVDIEIFRKKHTPMPSDLLNIKRPIVGYAGKMQSMFNVDLLKRTAAQYPNVSFVLIGKILDPNWMKDIYNISNIYYLGDKEYDVLPDYLNIDVTEVGLGGTVKVGKLHFENLELLDDKNVVVAAVKLTRAARGLQQEEPKK